MVTLLLYTGPDDPLFKRFKEWFTTSRQEARGHGGNFPDPGIFVTWQWEDDETSPTGPYRSESNWWACATLSWVRDQLEADTFPRGDYRELCELINLILGGNVRLNIIYILCIYHIEF